MPLALEEEGLHVPFTRGLEVGGYSLTGACSGLFNLYSLCYLTRGKPNASYKV